MLEEETIDLASRLAAGLGLAAASHGLSGTVRAASADLVEAARLAVPKAASDPAAFVEAFASAVRHLAKEGEPSSVADDLEAMGQDVAATAAFAAAIKAALVGAICIAILRISFEAQPDAAAARERVRSLAEAVQEPLGDILGPDAFAAIDRLTGDTALALSRLAADRSPLVRVQAGVSLPSTLLAFELYGDPERAGEIVRRAKVGTPLLMPVAFEALAQ